MVGGTVVKAAGDAIHEDDSIILSRMFNGVVVNLIFEYMLQQNEIDELIEKLNAIKPNEFKKLFRRVMAAKEQEKEIESFIRHYYEEIVRKRPMISEPTTEEISNIIQEYENMDSSKNNQSCSKEAHDIGDIGMSK